MTSEPLPKRASPRHHTKGRRRAAARAADHGQGLDRRRRLPVRRRVGGPCRTAARTGRHRRRPAARGRCGRGGQDRCRGAASHAESRHPLDPARLGGGSSSGEAVVVADGCVAARASAATPAAASASRRRGAACSGFKPTAGLVPTTGHFPRVGRAERRPHPDRSAGGDRRRSSSGCCRSSPVPTVRTPGVRAGARPLRIATASICAALGFAVLLGETESGRRRRRCSTRVDRPRQSLGGRRAATRDGWTMPWLDEALDITRALLAAVASSTGAAGGAAAVGLGPLPASIPPARRGRRLPPHAGHARDRAAASRRLGGDDFVFTLPASLTGSPAISIPTGPDR